MPATQPIDDFEASQYITPEMAAQLAAGGANPDCYEARYTNLKTEHMSSFTGQYVAPTRASKKAYVHQHRPFEGRTTNQDDFGYKGVPERRKPMKLGDNGLGGNDAPFQGDTTQKNDFRAWQVSRPPPAMKPNRNIAGQDDDRTFETENARSYTGAAYPPRKSRAPEQARSASIQFEGLTTNQADFQRWNSRPADLVDKSSKYRPRRDDRNFLTEAKTEYIKKPFDKTGKKGKPFDPCAPGTNLYMFAE